jgi:hypothetical protein
LQTPEASEAPSGSPPLELGTTTQAIYLVFNRKILRFIDDAL